MYSITLLREATRELSRLDKPIANRIVRKLQWLAQNFESVNPESLRGELAGLYKLREGDYRIAYQVLKSENTIVVHLIGHRREVYKPKG
jgi:mRNA interferase RelE/StbE